MAIDAITLALDGVIFDTEEAHLQACNAAFRNYGLSLQWSQQQLRAASRVHGATNALAAVIESMPLPALREDTARLVQEKNRLFHEFALARQPVRSSGCAQLMADALESGCKLAVVTDMPVQTATALLEHSFGNAVTNVFSVVVSGADFTALENGPYQLALRTVGVDPESAVTIEAAVPGLFAAQRSGLWTMAATPYEKDIARISGADIWCPQLQELRHVIEQRNAARARPQQFIGFDTLRAYKKAHFANAPVLKQPMQSMPVKLAA